MYSFLRPLGNNCMLSCSSCSRNMQVSYSCSLAKFCWNIWKNIRWRVWRWPVDLVVLVSVWPQSHSLSVYTKFYTTSPLTNIYTFFDQNTYICKTLTIQIFSSGVGPTTMQSFIRLHQSFIWIEYDLRASCHKMSETKLLGKEDIIMIIIMIIIMVIIIIIIIIIMDGLGLGLRVWFRSADGVSKWPLEYIRLCTHRELLSSSSSSSSS